MEALRLVTPTHPAAAPLLAGLRSEYHHAYGPAVAAELDRYSIFEYLPPAGAFLVLESDGITVAGGALRRVDAGVGEIKRMWTAPEHRGRGHARRVLAALERAGLRRGYHTVRLETGHLSAAALGLYRSSGYRELSGRAVGLEKRLDGADHLAADELDGREIVVREMLEHHTLYTRLRKAA
jgi:ribosomal protein S18 acetylase RimI-like enzyme